MARTVALRAILILRKVLAIQEGYNNDDGDALTMN